MVRAWKTVAERYTDDELALIVGFYGEIEQLLRDHIAVLRVGGREAGRGVRPTPPGQPEPG